jgi:hypothetical protein
MNSLVSSRSSDDLWLNKLGLLSGQRRSPLVAASASWYDWWGYLAGYGDLDSKDLIRVSQNLDNQNSLIVLPERTLSWAGHGITDRRYEDIPPEHIIQHATVIIQRDVLWVLPNLLMRQDLPSIDSGVEVRNLTYSAVKDLMKARL